MLTKKTENGLEYEEHTYRIYIKGITPEPEDYLKYLLCKDIVFINNGHWDKNWPKDKVTLHVGCNDVFAWGCADAEDIDYSDLETLYNAVRHDPVHGSDVWCISKRQQWPQKPVEDSIRKQGIHDLDKILEGVQKRTK